MSGQKITGAHAVLESLLAHGTTTIFGYPGGAVIPLYDVMEKDFVAKKRIKHILVRHEQAAAFAAGGVGRTTGRAGVCIATSGPGATNLATGVADAMMDSVPMVAITGQVFSHLIGTDAFQETDAIGVMMPITKHSIFVDRAADIAPAIAEAFFVAENGRPGPVHIDITKDAFLGETTFSAPPKPDLPGFSPTTAPSDFQIQKAIKLILSAKKPVVILGHGVRISRAEKEVLIFLKKTGIPAVSTLHGLSGIPVDDPHFISMLGMHGSMAANLATYHADLLISFGSRFDDRITGRLDDFAPKAKIIHCDIDPAEIGKNVPTAVPIVGDIKKILQKLNPKVSALNISKWKTEIKKWKNQFPIHCVQNQDEPMRAPEVIKILGEETGGKSFMVADVGQNQMFLAQHYPFQKVGRHISSGGLGTMGASLPLSVGVKIANPRDEVWSISGDGGFQMNLQELGTIAAENLDIKIAVLNNNFLGMVRQWQELYHDKNYASTEMKNPNFGQIAAAYGIPHFFADTPATARDAVKKARAIKGPTFIEFQIEKEENVFPMVDVGKSLAETRIQ